MGQIIDFPQVSENKKLKHIVETYETVLADLHQEISVLRATFEEHQREILSKHISEVEYRQKFNDLEGKILVLVSIITNIDQYFKRGQ